MAANSCSPNTGCEKDCRDIHDAWGQLNHLGQVLAYRSRDEICQLRETYKTMYGEDLVDFLNRAQSSNSKNEVCKALSLWLTEPHERDAMVALDALEHVETVYRALVEIYVGEKSSRLFLIQQAYHRISKSYLDHDISSLEPSTPYQRILLAIAASHRSHQADVSQYVAKCDAKRLYEAGKGQNGTTIDELTVLEILSKRSIQQLKLTFSAYKHIYGHDYIKTLRNDRTSGEFEGSFRAVVKCLYTPQKYYAKILHTSIKGKTADKSALLRVIVRRTEIDMKEIKDVYHKKYGKKLHDAICESTPEGDYRDFVIALITRP